MPSFRNNYRGQIDDGEDTPVFRPRGQRPPEPVAPVTVPDVVPAPSVANDIESRPIEIVRAVDPAPIPAWYPEGTFNRVSQALYGEAGFAWGVPGEDVDYHGTRLTNADGSWEPVFMPAVWGPGFRAHAEWFWSTFPREYESKYHAVVSSPPEMPGDVVRITLQNPGMHKYDTLYAYYRQGEWQGTRGWFLQGPPVPSRQTSSGEQLRDNVELAAKGVAIAGAFYAAAYGLSTMIGPASGLEGLGAGLETGEATLSTIEAGSGAVESISSVSEYSMSEFTELLDMPPQFEAFNYSSGESLIQISDAQSVDFGFNGIEALDVPMEPPLDFSPPDLADNLIEGIGSTPEGVGDFGVQNYGNEFMRQPIERSVSSAVSSGGGPQLAQNTSLLGQARGAVSTVRDAVSLYGSIQSAASAVNTLAGQREGPGTARPGQLRPQPSATNSDGGGLSLPIAIAIVAALGAVVFFA